MISGSKSPGHKKLLLLIFMLKSHETGLTLPHVYEEIKGDMRKMQMRQQPETIKEKNFKKRSPCMLPDIIRTVTCSNINIFVCNLSDNKDNYVQLVCRCLCIPFHSPHIAHATQTLLCWIHSVSVGLFCTYFYVSYLLFDTYNRCIHLKFMC
jgi:hypothetical protein